ncbi:hypothetical protein NPIL_111231, partial [Nephila pilipes]
KDVLHNEVYIQRLNAALTLEEWIYINRKESKGMA